MQEDKINLETEIKKSEKNQDLYWNGLSYFNKGEELVNKDPLKAMEQYKEAKKIFHKLADPKNMDFGTWINSLFKLKKIYEKELDIQFNLPGQFDEMDIKQTMEEKENIEKRIEKLQNKKDYN